MPRHLSLRDAVLALIAAPLLVWPALINGFPLLFPDSLDYIEQGSPVLYALLHASHPPFTGMRSALYALAILPFHLNRFAWAILLLHVFAVVFTVYLTIRTVAPHQARRATPIILIILCGCTAMPWYISLLMPDILGAPAYLALFLLAFARDLLSPAERALLVLVAILGITAHTTHLILVVALVVFFALFRFREANKPSLRLPAFAVIAAATLLLAINYRLFSHASLTGNHPPYLEARLLADGSAADYLRSRCPDANLPLLCAHLDRLPANDDEFLWGDGLYSTGSPADQQELLREESPLARATLRTHFAAQFRISAENFFAQLTGFGLDDFDNNDYMQAHLDDALTGSRAHYDRSLQARNAMPWHVASMLQNIAVVASLLFLAFCFRHAGPALWALTLTALLLTIANAALAGVFSEVDSRYQARVVWLIPLAAMLMLLEQITRRTHSEPQSSSS